MLGNTWADATRSRETRCGYSECRAPFPAPRKASGRSRTFHRRAVLATKFAARPGWCPSPCPITRWQRPSGSASHSHQASTVVCRPRNLAIGRTPTLQLADAESCN